MNLELGCKISKLKAELLRKLLVLGKCSVGNLSSQFSAVKGIYLFSRAKTYLIEARQRIFSRYLVSKHPPEAGDQTILRARKSSLNKRRCQMSSARASQKLIKCRDDLYLQPSTEKAKHYGKQLGLMDMMDNSPLRSELTTYPQPLLLFF